MTVVLTSSRVIEPVDGETYFIDVSGFSPTSTYKIEFSPWYENGQTPPSYTVTFIGSTDATVSVEQWGVLKGYATIIVPEGSVLPHTSIDWSQTQGPNPLTVTVESGAVIDDITAPYSGPSTYTVASGGTAGDLTLSAAGPNVVTVDGTVGSITGYTGESTGATLYLDSVVLGPTAVTGVIDLASGNDTLTAASGYTNTATGTGILGGSGNDLIQIADDVHLNSVDVAAVSGGAGNDTISLVQAPEGTSWLIDGGGGSDTGVVSTATQAQADAFSGGVTASGWTSGSTTPTTVEGRTFAGIETLSVSTASGAPCFTPGTLIATPAGPRPIETLTPGALVLTADNGAQPLRWIGRARLDAARLAANPRLQPVRIAAGALGPGLPRRDLLVSPQHRMLVRSRIAARMFGPDEVLIAAIRLVGLPGIDTLPCPQVEYLHLAFDAHQIVTAEGAPSESFFPGEQGLAALGAEQRAELLALFPTLPLTPARTFATGQRARTLARRHGENGRVLVA